MRGRIKEDGVSVPRPHGPFEYYSRYETGAQHRSTPRKRRIGGNAEEVLLTRRRRRG